MSTTSDINEDSDQRPQPEFPCLQSTDKPVLLTASSVQKGIKVKECICNQNFGVEYKEDLQNGIFLGKQSYHQLTEQETADIQHWISDIDLGKIPPLFNFYYPSINDVVRMKAAARLVLVKEINGDSDSSMDERSAYEREVDAKTHGNEAICSSVLLHP